VLQVPLPVEEASVATQLAFPVAVSAGQMGTMSAKEKQQYR